MHHGARPKAGFVEMEELAPMCALRSDVSWARDPIWDGMGWDGKQDLVVAGAGAVGAET